MDSPRCGAEPARCLIIDRHEILRAGDVRLGGTIFGSLPVGRLDELMAAGAVILTRRNFAGFASCAICEVAGFVVTDASATEEVPPIC
jgi:hypothetical protein